MSLHDIGLPEEVHEWLTARGVTTLDELTALSVADLERLPDFDEFYVWDIEDALSPRGLSLKRAEAADKLGMVTLESWLERLAASCPHASGVTLEGTRAAMEQQGFPMSRWDGPAPLSHFKDVLHALAATQPEWLYYTDWRWSRADAARVFERWLGLPEGRLDPAEDEPLGMVAGDANLAARAAGIEDRIYQLPPYEDDIVFARMTPELRGALIEGFVLAPQSIDDHLKRGEAPLVLDEDMELEGVDAFDEEALNVFQNLGARTVGDLLQMTPRDLRRYKAPSGVPEHVLDVLTRAGLSMRG